MDIHEEFRRAWREAMQGNEIPLAELWDALNERARGLLATDQPAPSDKDVENAYVEYIDEKYR